ncbi:hypothetical protein VPH35_011313 [Triticum aestivum]|uniref:uncharacterized protein isoform X1 n=1 Tax=Triticum aestivum TaxID=4565 RepID=UPI000842CF5D|nr:uncharacterized protein LOC123098964 isoform X1 [Triticum aestivum]
MAALAQAPSPAESIDPPTRDHRQSVTAADGTGRGMVYNLAYLELPKCASWSLPGGLCVLHELEELGSFSSDKTSEISKPGRSDEEFIMVGSTFRMDAHNLVKTGCGSAKSDLSVGLILYTLVTRDHKIINNAPLGKPHSSECSRRLEVYTNDVSVTDRQKGEKHDGNTLKSTDARLALKRKSCKNDLVSKGNHAHPDNGFVTDSSGETSLSLNAATETPMHYRPEGGLVHSGAPSHPAAAQESGTTPLTKTPGAAWLVASSAANHMTGDLSQLTDCMPAPADLVVQVPSMGPRQVQDIGSLNTRTMCLQNVYYVPGLDKNLVSSSQLAKLGYTITLGPSECRVTKNDQGHTLVGKAHFTDDYLFELDFLRVPPSTN